MKWLRVFHLDRWRQEDGDEWFSGDLEEEQRHRISRYEGVDLGYGTSRPRRIRAVHFLAGSVWLPGLEDH